MNVFTIISIVCTVGEKPSQSSSIGMEKKDNRNYLKITKGCNFLSKKFVVCLPSIL